MSNDAAFDLKAYLARRRALVDQALRLVFPEPSGPAAGLVSSMTYSLFAGGKRLRPILCIAGAEAVGGAAETVMPVACALECIHTYSLIHDDLPVMDDDDMRRGKPTNHKVYGEALALLAGDGLLTEAFALMCRPPATGRPPAERLLRVVELVARAAGWEGMVGGQVVDVGMEGQKADLSTLEFIHRHKTGDLIAASVLSGAILCGADAEATAHLEAYGLNIGLAFQISDDILGVEGDPALLGKAVGSDAARGKNTFPALMGVERARARQNELVQAAVQVLRNFGPPGEPLRRLARYIIERNR